MVTPITQEGRPGATLTETNQRNHERDELAVTGSDGNTEASCARAAAHGGTRR